MATDHLATLRQTVPRLWHLIGQLRPTFHLDTVAAVDAEFLRSHRIRAALWDVDGTIMSYHGRDVDPGFVHVRELFRTGPARHAILSNCDEVRFEELGRIFPEVPIVRGYTTSDGPVFRSRTNGTDTHTPGDVERLLAAGGRQIRKPSGELVRYCMRALEVDDPDAVLMVGDQYLTDIASANLAGVRSAKVKTFRRGTFPLQIRISQRIEALLYAAVGRAID